MDRSSLVAWWEGLASRERALLSSGAAVVVATIVYLLLWEPPASGIRKLQGDLPELRSQEASMRAMADEAGRLRAAGGSTQAVVPAERQAAVRRSLQRAGLWREGAGSGPRPEAAAGVSGNTISTLSVAGAVTTVTAAVTSRLEPPAITAEANDRVRVRFDDIDYGVWIAWLAATEGELAARATKVTVVALAPKAPVGHVRAEVVLDWTQPAPPSPRI